MLPKVVEKFTRRLNGNQGVKGLAIRDMTARNGVPVMVSAWEPTPAEIEAIKRGEAVYLWVMGSSHPPVTLTVGQVE